MQDNVISTQCMADIRGTLLHVFADCSHAFPALLRFQNVLLITEVLIKNIEQMTRYVMFKTSAAFILWKHTHTTLIPRSHYLILLTFDACNYTVRE